ncbi:MAG: AAA family ATPase, partial [Planctomycetales bacterium]|nr:AAA family ATPase [Planctomycetales bacterium]
ELFQKGASDLGIEYHQSAVDHLLETHYKATGRPMRFCHPRDLLHQVSIFCDFHDRPPALSNESVDAA